MDDLERGRLVAFADQLEAIKRDKDARLRRELEEGPDPGRPPVVPLRVWLEGVVWCAVAAGPTGALCGYARCPDGHPWVGLHYGDEVPDPAPIDEEMLAGEAADDFGVMPVFLAGLSGEGIGGLERTLAGQVRVHGGVTWTGPVPIVGAPHGWWVGFDCGHAGDVPIPELALSPVWREYAERTVRMMSELGGHQWTVEEVVLETGRVAAAIRAAG